MALKQPRPPPSLESYWIIQAGGGPQRNWGLARLTQQKKRGVTSGRLQIDDASGLMGKAAGGGRGGGRWMSFGGIMCPRRPPTTPSCHHDTANVLVIILSFCLRLWRDSLSSFSHKFILLLGDSLVSELFVCQNVKVKGQSHGHVKCTNRPPALFSQ